MARKRATSVASEHSSHTVAEELGSMYDYLAKVILLGPSGCGKSCLLHRFLKNECMVALIRDVDQNKALSIYRTGRVLSSQTIGVEFASKIVRVGTGARRKRVKLQLWDTAGTERFRSVSRSYYRGAAGAILVYDVSSRASFKDLSTFLHDAKALASPHLITVLAGNKADLADGSMHDASSLLDLDPSNASIRTNDTSQASLRSKSSNWNLGSANTATIAPEGREVSANEASTWAAENGISVALDVSALNGENVNEAFERLARTLLTKIEIGEIDPDDPQSGIQYGDISGYDMDNGSIRSGVTDGSGMRRRRRRGGGGLSDWDEVFSLERRRRNCC